MLSVKKYLLNTNAVLDCKTTTSVVCGWHIETRQPVVAKIFDIARMNAMKRDCAFKEVEVMKRLSGHRYIVTILDSFEVDNKLFLIMENVESDLLKYVNTHHPIANKEFERIWKQLVEVVSFLHEQNIAHLDIKLENILFDEKTKTIRLIDFGHCKLFTERQVCTTKGLVGSPFYVAPEVFVCEQYDAYKADIYSMGVVFYALNQGSLPFNDQNGPQYYVHLLNRNQSNKQTTRPDLRFIDETRHKSAEKFSSLITKMLDIEPKRRPSLLELQSLGETKTSLLTTIKNFLF